MITAGVDLWLNTPQPPMEASGTSGMKAALNAVPSLSVLDGWLGGGPHRGGDGVVRRRQVQGAQASLTAPSTTRAPSTTSLSTPSFPSITTTGSGSSTS
ncbi:MAG: hypothetical protein MZU97_08945 [Bacillus subtilis]|nr:hypothetical protein [Bacillus subtilis]